MNYEHEALRCQRDFWYCATKYLKIQDKRARLVKLQPRPPQVEVINKLVNEGGNLYLLKSRQIGGTTIVSAFYFWKWIFTKGYRIAVIAHHEKAVKKLFRIYATFWAHFPKWMRPAELGLSQVHLHAANDRRIDVGTAGSELWRGFPYQAYHLSEFAFYEKGQLMVKSALAGAPDDAYIVKETTANGFNHAYRSWNAKDAYFKLFIPWSDDPTYVRRKPFDETTPALEDYLARHKDLTPEQFNWVRHRFSSKLEQDLKSLLQEFPLTADEAFVAHGGRVFPFFFQDVVDPEDGLVEYLEPERDVPHVMGIDVATGDNESDDSDYQAYTVLSVRDRRRPETAAVQRCRVPLEQFCQDCLATAKRYNALVVIEANHLGAAVLDYFVQRHYPHIYKRKDHDKTGDKMVERMGWYTSVKTRPLLQSKLISTLRPAQPPPPKEETDCKMFVVDDRMRSDINTWEWASKTRADHMAGEHDDVLISCGLALMGIEQLGDWTPMEDDEDVPRTAEEVLRWEAKHGMSWEEAHGDETNETLLSIPY